MTKFETPRLAFGAIAAAAAALGAGAAAQDVTRYGIEGSSFPISESVVVKAGTDTAYVSGAVPSALDPEGDRAKIATYGDMETQTVSVLSSIEARLERLGLGLGDVVMMRAYLVAGENGAVDFSGFMAGYTQFFGTEAQPNLPSRSAVEVAGLSAGGWLLEIDVVAAGNTDADAGFSSEGEITGAGTGTDEDD